MLLDAVICHHNRSHKTSISHDQAFNQHEVFRASVRAEYKMDPQGALKNTPEGDSGKEHEEGDVSLVIDEQWFSLIQLREKLLGREDDGSLASPSNKRGVIVEGRLSITKLYRPHCAF